MWIYVIVGLLAVPFTAVASIALFLWGLGGIVNTMEQAEIEDEET